MIEIKDLDVEKIFERNVPGVRDVLSQKTVAIAGCGGSGSNAAVALVRAGIGKLIIADFDVVEISNLNRQYYFIDDIGKRKVEALSNHLLKINPTLTLETHCIELTKENMSGLFHAADLLIEAFDRAESKAWLIETWCGLFPEKPVVCASGISGFGNSNSLKAMRAGNLIVCGDQETDMSMGLTASRVIMAASMQANEAIELLMKKGNSHDTHQ
ncbi:MAG: sulfur carrier protein ThiS adenylyltransferase ThiF [Candidatus Omnitrophota bacterium]